MDIADLATLITVAGVSIYVAGLFGLVIAIWLRYTEDIATAWYAVTLLSRTDVAGQGVRIWLIWPIPITLVLIMLDTLKEHFSTINKFLGELTPLTGLVVLILFLGSTLHTLGYEASQRVARDHTGHFVAATLIATVGGLLMSKGLLLIVQGAKAADISVLRALTQAEFFGPLGFFLFGSVLVGVAGAAVLDYPLPRVQVEHDPTVSPNPPSCSANELYLVTHSEGHWHLLDGDENELVSLPDRLVLTVHTLPQLQKRQRLEEPRK